MKDDEQYLIWCDTNLEADLLKKYIPEAVEVRGSDKPQRKERCALNFKNGKIRVLISKPKIFGYGMNFQKCHNVIFCGLTYSSSIETDLPIRAKTRCLFLYRFRNNRNAYFRNSK